MVNLPLSERQCIKNLIRHNMIHSTKHGTLWHLVLFFKCKKITPFFRTEKKCVIYEPVWKKKWQIKCDWFIFKHAIFPSLFHNLMRLIQFLDTQHNLSLPALTEYWLFFDMQTKKKITKKINKIKKKNSEFLFSLLNWHFHFV